MIPVPDLLLEIQVTRIAIRAWNLSIIANINFIDWGTSILKSVPVTDEIRASKSYVNLSFEFSAITQSGR